MWHTSQTPQHCNSLEDLTSLLNVKHIHTSPSSGLFILLLASSLLISLGRNQGSLRRLAETSVSSFQAAGCKLLFFQIGMLVAPPHLCSPDWPIRVYIRKRIHAPGARVGPFEASCWFRQTCFRKTGLPRPGGASSFWLFGVKITVCNLNSSWLQWALPRTLLLWVPSPLDRTISQVSGAPERGRQLGSQSRGSRWPFTHCPGHDADQQVDTEPRGYEHSHVQGWKRNKAGTE